MFEIGAKLGGRFLVLRVFQGGLGMVCLVRDMAHGADRDNPVFILKFPKSLDSEEQQATFRRETAIWVALGRHPAIVPAFWVDIVGSKLCVAAEFIEPDDHGRASLRDHLDGQAKPLRQIVRWTAEFVYGLEHAVERGLVCHGDIKPENLLIDRDGNLLITDFGMAKVSQSNATFSGGTPAYMSPEHWLGIHLDIRADLYAFGLILCELCYGRRPWAGNSIAELRRNHLEAVPSLAPHPCRTLILGLLQKDEQARYSISQFRAHLSQIAKEQQILLPTLRARTDDDEMQELRAKSSIEGLKGGVRETFEAALEITRRWPEDTSGWTQLGRLYISIGDFRKAHAATARSLSLDDTRSAPWNNLGIIWGEFGEPEKAITSFRMALDCDPGNTGSMLNLAKPLALLGRRSEAIAVLHEALALAPDKFAAWVNLAGYLWEDGQREPGIAALNRAYVLAPADMKTRIAEQLSDWMRKGKTGH